MPPVILFALLVTSATARLDIVIEGYTFPDGINSLGLLITLSTVVMIPMLMVYQIAKAFCRGRKLGSALFKAKGKWAKKAATDDENADGEEYPIREDTYMTSALRGEGGTLKSRHSNKA